MIRIMDRWDFWLYSNLEEATKDLNTDPFYKKYTTAKAIDLNKDSPEAKYVRTALTNHVEWVMRND